ncbi:MAG: hypothetical protein ABJF23_15890 [Bryobacteraceae bacterium]
MDGSPQPVQSVRGRTHKRILTFFNDHEPHSSHIRNDPALLVETAFGAVIIR